RSYRLISRSGLPPPAELRVSLLVAVQVHQLPIAVRVRPAHAPRLLVVALQLLPIQEGHPTDRADPVLPLGQPHVPGGQVPGVHPAPPPPVFPETGVIRGGRAADQDVPGDLEPAEPQEVGPGALVAKRPVVVPLRVQLAPIAPLAPLPGLVA